MAIEMGSISILIERTVWIISTLEIFLRRDFRQEEKKSKTFKILLRTVQKFRYLKIVWFNVFREIFVLKKKILVKKQTFQSYFSVQEVRKRLSK